MTRSSGFRCAALHAAVEEAGGKVIGIVAVVDREEGGKDILEAVGRKVLALTTVTALGLKDPG